MAELLEWGYKKQKLRAHSDYMWNTACNAWAKEFWDYADIMVESKAKNLASMKLYEEFTSQASTLPQQDPLSSDACQDQLCIPS